MSESANEKNFGANPEIIFAERPIQKKKLTPEATRALAEAQARRDAEKPENAPVEIAGRGGLEPVRYGDWEIKGLASDF